MKSVDRCSGCLYKHKRVGCYELYLNNINASGTLDTDKQIALTDYDMLTSLSSSNPKKLNDGDPNTYIYSYLYYDPQFVIKFKSAKTFVWCRYS